MIYAKFRQRFPFLLKMLHITCIYTFYFRNFQRLVQVHDVQEKQDLLTESV